MGIATAPLIVPADCPYDFPALNALGEQLLRVLGPPQFPGWSAEYAPRPQETCPLCGQPLVRSFSEDAGVRFLPDGAPQAVHHDCALLAARKKVTDMATSKITWSLPPCRNCGNEYMDHDRPITTIWEAECDVEREPGVPHRYRPSEPFRARSWPFGLITDSPFYKGTP